MKLLQYVIANLNLKGLVFYTHCREQQIIYLTNQNNKR